MNELHRAALYGSATRTLSLVSSGYCDIDQGTPSDGFTPLMIATFNGHSCVAQILLDNGASVSKVDDGGFTAVHFAAQEGQLALTKLLVKAGSDLEATSSRKGCTPLHLAAGRGHSEVMSALIDAGANPNSRMLDGGTPIHGAVQDGHLEAMRVLLRAKADPSLPATNSAGVTSVPLNAAAEAGHLEVVRELVEQVGLRGCGGATGGADALEAAAKNENMEIMAILTDGGAFDTGSALDSAASHGREKAVKFLLQQQEGQSSFERLSYVNARDPTGKTVVVGAIEFAGFSSARIARLLVDAGADTSWAVRLTDKKGRVKFNDTPLALTELYLRQKKICGKDATEAQLKNLEAIRRLLLRVEAVHAASWRWHNEIPPAVHSTTEDKTKTKIASAPLVAMLPILRRRATRRDVVLAALDRW